MLCSWGTNGPHKGPFPNYVAALQEEHSRAITNLIYWQDTHQLGPSDETQLNMDYYDRWAQYLWDHIESLTNLPDPYGNTTTADEYLAYQLALASPIAREGRIDYAAIKERIDLVDYIGRITELRPIGTKFKGRCPLHAEKTPSLWVYPETRSWYCFGCRKGGDLFDFTKEYSNTPAAQIE